MMNSTVQYTSSQNVEMIAACILNLICSVTGGIGNLLVLLSYYYYRSMRTITNLYLCNLAFVDLIVCAIIQPLYMTTLVKKLTESEQNVYFETGRRILTWCIMTVASGSLTTVMLDRYILVSYPLKYRTVINKRSCIAIMFPWFVGIVAAIMLISKPTVAVIIQAYAVFLITGLVIPGYIRVFFIARRQSKKIMHRNKYLKEISSKHMMRTALANVPDKKSCKTSDYEAIKTIFIVIGSFIICWAPLLFFPFYYRRISPKSKANIVFIFPVINTLALCSSSINPFIYCFRTPPFKHSFQKIIVRFYKTITCTRKL